MTATLFPTEELPDRLAVGLVRLAAALDAVTHRHASTEPHTLTEQQVLLLLAQRGEPYPLGELASRLGMSVAGTLASVGRLRGDGLVTVNPAPSYSPEEVGVELTELGRTVPQPLLNWAGLLLERLDSLPAEEQQRLLALVVGRIAALQRDGHIPVTRMCLNCRFFQPHTYVGQPQPHHCALVNAAFGHTELRLHCPEQQERIVAESN
jgi:DNA-binding MarR family transcriptional regulator